MQRSWKNWLASHSETNASSALRGSGRRRAANFCETSCSPPIWPRKCHSRWSISLAEEPPSILGIGQNFPTGPHKLVEGCRHGGELSLFYKVLPLFREIFAPVCTHNESRRSGGVACDCTATACAQWSVPAGTMPNGSRSASWWQPAGAPSHSQLPRRLALRSILRFRRRPRPQREPHLVLPSPP